MTTERRKFPRFQIAAEVAYSGEGATQRGRVSDISMVGIFIDTLNPLADGSLVRFSFLFPGDDSGVPFTGEGTVSWRQPMLGMGIKFTAITKENRERLRSFLASR